MNIEQSGVYSSTPVGANPDETQEKKISPIDIKTYSLARKIFEGLGLILLNVVTLGTINLDLLRDNSWLNQEYNAVFGGKSISVVTHDAKPKKEVRIEDQEKMDQEEPEVIQPDEPQVLKRDPGAESTDQNPSQEMVLREQADSVQQLDTMTVSTSKGQVDLTLVATEVQTDATDPENPSSEVRGLFSATIGNICHLFTASMNLPFTLPISVEIPQQSGSQRLLLTSGSTESNSELYDQTPLLRSPRFLENVSASDLDMPSSDLAQPTRKDFTFVQTMALALLLNKTIPGLFKNKPPLFPFTGFPTTSPLQEHSIVPITKQEEETDQQTGGIWGTLSSISNRIASSLASYVRTSPSSASQTISPKFVSPGRYQQKPVDLAALLDSPLNRNDE
jgi:hypothetical protein